MKKRSLLLGLVVLLTATTGALANGEAKDGKTAKSPAKENGKTQKARPKQQKTIVTGSYIKQTVRRNGQIADGPYPLWVIDSKAIQNSGASDLRQLLFRQGVNH